MTYRRRPAQQDAARAWARFVAANETLWIEAGLPGLAMESLSHWEDLLMHGAFDHHVDPLAFRIEALDPAQYTALVRLADCYFASGYEYFVPMALHADDQQRLSARYLPNR